MGGKDYQNIKIVEPPNEIVVVEDRFVFHQPITLIISGKLLSLSTNEFTIKDTNGTDYFKCNGSMINRVIINDLYDLPILNIRNQILSLKDKITVYRGDENKEVLATISQKSVLNVKKYTLEFFNQATDKKEFLDLKCDLMGSKCGVFYGKEKDNAPMVCKIIRKIENKSLLASPQESYYVDISPGVDIAIIVAATICFDQLKKE